MIIPSTGHMVARTRSQRISLQGIRLDVLGYINMMVLYMNELGSCTCRKMVLNSVPSTREDLNPPAA